MIQAYDVETVRRAEDELRARLMTEGDDARVLMKRAAKGIAAVVAARVEEVEAARVVVLAGPGDNGGDALYAAARLTRKGIPVTVVSAVEKPHEHAHAAARKAGVPVLFAHERAALADARTLVAEADLVVDGLLGIGGRPGLSDGFAQLAEAIDEDAYVVAIDLPSGADPAGLVADPDGIFADETLAMGCLKPVHVLPATRPCVGVVTVIDIGLEIEAVPAAEQLTYDDAGELWPVPGPSSDKYRRGVLGVIAGSQAYPGAAALVCTAAVEAGAGMVRYVGPGRAEDLVLHHAPEVVPGDGRVQAWVIGPGLADADALDDAQRAAAQGALGSDVPVLLDAGGLALWESPREAPTLLTPHAGELASLMSRLTGTEVSREDVEATPVQWAREAADRTGARVLLKGSTTVVAGPQRSLEPVRVQDDAPSWLATAGAGDTLAGIAGTLLAAGLTCADAGALAALVHGLAATHANPGGPVRALEVGRAVPEVVADLLRR